MLAFSKPCSCINLMGRAVARPCNATFLNADGQDVPDRTLKRFCHDFVTLARKGVTPECVSH